MFQQPDTSVWATCQCIFFSSEDHCQIPSLTALHKSVIYITPTSPAALSIYTTTSYSPAALLHLIFINFLHYHHHHLDVHFLPRSMKGCFQQPNVYDQPFATLSFLYFPFSHSGISHLVTVTLLILFSHHQAVRRLTMGTLEQFFGLDVLSDQTSSD